MQILRKYIHFTALLSLPGADCKSDSCKTALSALINFVKEEFHFINFDNMSSPSTAFSLGVENIIYVLASPLQGYVIFYVARCVIKKVLKLTHKCLMCTNYALKILVF